MEVSAFFSRLLAAPKPAAPARLPDDAADLHAAWTGVVETLEHPDERQLARGIGATAVPAQLRHIVDALVYEANRVDEDTTGVCLEYFFKHDVLGTLERLSEADRPFGIKREVVQALNNLVVLMPERFLVHNAVHRPLRRLLRSCIGETDDGDADKEPGKRLMGAAAMQRDRVRDDSDEELEGDVVDLMCILCSKMRAYPPLLLIFFHDKGWLVPHATSGAPSADPIRALSPTPSTLTAPSLASGTATVHHFEFLVFSYLLRFVHREGRTGDFARAGLLFLFDIAFLSLDNEGSDNLSLNGATAKGDPLQDARDALAEYVLDGDCADVMAAGLGALYAALPSTLRVPGLAEHARDVQGAAGAKTSASVSGGMQLGGGTGDGEAEEGEQRSDGGGGGMPASTDADVRAQLDLFLKLCGFLQDIIVRCSSALDAGAPAPDGALSTVQVLGPAIADAALDAIEASFVDGILYPSILECVAADGSAVAVMTYLNVLLAHLDDGPLLRRILAVLTDTRGGTAAPGRRSARQAKCRTGAIDYMALHQRHDYYADSARFTLKDLVLDNLQSRQGAAAALRLLDTLLSRHCSTAVTGLLTVIRDPDATALARRPLPLPDDDAPFLPAPVTSSDPGLQETELYGSLLSRLDPAQTSAEPAGGYAAYLADALALLQADPCAHAARIPMQFAAPDNGWLRTGRARQDDDALTQHRLGPGDALVGALLGALADWFRTEPDTNVALTGVLASLACCGARSLAGWLVYDLTPADAWAAAAGPGSGADDSDDDGGGGAGRASVTPRAEPDPFTARAAVDLPAIYQVVRELVRQVARFRAEVDGFDRLLAERRHGLLFADHLDEAMSAMLDTGDGGGVAAGSASATASALAFTSPFASPSSAAAAAAASPAHKRRPGALASSLKSFLTPRKRDAASPVPDQPQRSASPALDRTNIRHSGGAADGDTVPAAHSPFKSHYDAAAETRLYAQAATPPAAGPWSPARSRALRAPAERAAAARVGNGHGRHDEDEDGDEDAAGPVQVSLSRVLDNCVVLEELVKEIVAVIVARRALGIDQVGYT
ncbi:hypothetical protein Q5752_002573 [Cryptotrichosporon argae]